MYEIKFSSKRLRKKFEEIVNLLKDEKGYCELEYALQNNHRDYETFLRKYGKKKN
jgi:hypothetical protein